MAKNAKSSSEHWEIYSFAGAGDFSAYLPGYAPATIRSGVNIADGRWHHVAMVADGAILRLYRNGKEVAATAYNGLNGNPDIKALAIATKLGDDSIEPAGRLGGFWDGCIDHLAIFNGALTPEQIQKLYEVGDTSMRDFRRTP